MITPTLPVCLLSAKHCAHLITFPNNPVGKVPLFPSYRCCSGDSDKEIWEEVELRDKGRCVSTLESVSVKNTCICWIYIT